MFEIIEDPAFSAWLTKLKDTQAKAKIAGRIQRLAHGLAGDVEPVGEGVSELRVHIGPGYRVYFVRQGATVIVLLCGGDKSSQVRDIKAAKALARQWKAKDR
ncbi:type II toxin-antitoxin system RelE/ParE family toxin [Devosia sp.]|uniref:type II toxin-antitoxin system RelE/ParE family toxin n=1 Tax=Devosia sp. TaxID=1871048 RepID=UPI002FC9A6BA